MGKISTSDGKATTTLNNNSNNLRVPAATRVPCQSLFILQTGWAGPEREGAHLKSHSELMAMLTYSGRVAEVTEGTIYSSAPGP